MVNSTFTIVPSARTALCGAGRGLSAREETLA
jgi:hypothetical protein